MTPAAQAVGTVVGGFVSESAAASSDSAATPKKGKKATEPRPNFFARVALFVRQVIAELRKVIWPTRPQLRTYTIVVLIFVVAFGLFVAGLDIVFTKFALWLFGN
jgi:preprotein translocase subunit SecE